MSESALDELDLTDDQYALSSNKNNKEIDFDALLEARVLDRAGGRRREGGRVISTLIRVCG